MGFNMFVVIWSFFSSSPASMFRFVLFLSFPFPSSDLVTTLQHFIRFSLAGPFLFNFPSPYPLHLSPCKKLTPFLRPFFFSSSFTRGPTSLPCFLSPTRPVCASHCQFCGSSRSPISTRAFPPPARPTRDGRFYSAAKMPFFCLYNAIRPKQTPVS